MYVAQPHHPQRASQAAQATSNRHTAPRALSRHRPLACTCTASPCATRSLHMLRSHSNAFTHTAVGLRTQQLQQLRMVNNSTHHPGNKRHVACRVLTESAQLEIGSRAPDFELPDPLTGKSVSLAHVSAGAKATLVMFICNHCPFVVMLKSAIAEVAQEYASKGLAVVAISSNSTTTHPQDGPEKMAEDAQANGYTFPYLYDASQDTAKAYKAACTPEFYVFGSALTLTYHGQFDDARPNNGKPVTGADLRVALDAALAGSPLPADFKPRPSIGCNIKWHPGQEPDYYGTQVVKK